MRVVTYLPLYLVAFISFLLLSFSASLSAADINLLRNVTPSLPLGFYVETKSITWKKGEIVSLNLPNQIINSLAKFDWYKRGDPLLKVIEGEVGDRVCHAKGSLRINGKPIVTIRSKDSQGLTLPRRLGCYKIKRDEFFPLNKKYRRSFDGRYFGPLKKTMAIGRVVPIFTF